MPNITLLNCALLSVLVSACATAPETVQPIENKIVNDFPTRDRVEYVLNCVAQHGGLTYISQYACGCKIDKIAEKMSFNDFESAKTFGYLKSTPGDAGGAFRDPKQAKDLGKRLKEAEADAEKQCFVK
ncbi:MAG: hypothetical protein LAC70_09085 [Methylovulum sp.]|jgi:hypothetical protein|nr:hypothetical protein [Methylovulum sp.]